MDQMLRAALVLPLAVLTLVAGMPKAPKDPVKPGVTYLYTYYDRQGRLVINNLPPAYMKAQGLVLKHVGVGRVRLAVTPAEMAKALKSPELIAMVDEISLAEDPFDPRQNISGGVKYLRWLHDYYSGDLIRVVAAYNAGEGAVNKHKGIPPFRETQAYVPKVLDLYHRKAVQPDPNLAGSMALLQKGRGGFRVDEQKAVPEPSPQQRASARIYQWIDANGRTQISDQPPPKGTAGVKPFGAP